MSTFATHKVYSRPATLEEAYIICDHLIKASVAGFVKKHHCDYEDALSDANFAMIAAYNGHNPEKGSFGARVCHEVWCGMMDGLRLKAKHYERYPTKNVKLENLEKKQKNNIHNFVIDLSEDAKSVVDLLFDLDSNYKPSKSRKKLLYDALVEIGWTASRIVESFKEISISIGDRCPRRYKPEQA